MLTFLPLSVCPLIHCAMWLLRHGCALQIHTDVVPVGTKTYDAVSPKTNDDSTGSESSNRQQGLTTGPGANRWFRLMVRRCLFGSATGRAQ
jgi:hypothetical protein